jgi:aminoglycoside phosphotransferase (APT) family kinase protein
MSATTASTRRTTEADDDQHRVVAWLQANVGGEVTAIRRQPRWRPVWFADVASGGEVRHICVRGDRRDAELVMPLEHEHLFQKLLEDHGIPVPHVIGWCDDPRASVMETIPGRSDFDRASDAERATVVDEYVQTLARLHALPTEPFKEAGVIRAPRPADCWRVGMERYEDVYRRGKRRPDPLMEFVLGWLWRHPLPDSDREAPIVWDSGQFHHLDGHFTHIVDLEIGHLGDPMMDLAGWRMRDSIVPFGDFKQIYARYEELTGTPVDLPAIQWHHVAFTLTNQLVCHTALAEPTVDTDYMTYSHWVSETNLYTLEAMAEILGIEVEPVEIPDDDESSVSVATEHLVRSLRTIEVDDEFGRYQLRMAFRLARHVQRHGQIGRAMEQEDLDDLQRLLGHRPETWADGEAELERYILADAGAHDAELVVLLTRRWTRYKALMGPAGSAMATHLPIQPFA